MKKFLAVFLCMVIMAVMIPSFFASANPLPAAAEAVVVAADDSGQVDNSLADPFTLITNFIALWGGLFKTIVGSDVWQNFIPALKKVLSLVSLGEFFKAVRALWEKVTG